MAMLFHSPSQSERAVRSGVESDEVDSCGVLDSRFYIDTLQLEQSEYNLIRYPQRGVCLYKCGNERYNLMVHAPEYKEKLFGSAGGR